MPAPTDPTQAFAKEIIDSFITDIFESRLDVSVPYKVSRRCEGEQTSDGS